MDKILNFPYTWHSVYKEKTKSYYVAATVHTGVKINGRWKSYPVYLQQILIASESEIHKVDIDHKNHDTLDNRKDNLRVSFRLDNSKNRNGRNSNNKTGYRNVFFDVRKKKKPYIVQIQINGKNTKLGAFDTPEEAGAFATKMRNKYYGEFEGTG